jgi:hypothetical protein
MKNLNNDIFLPSKEEFDESPRKNYKFVKLRSNDLFDFIKIGSLYISDDQKFINNVVYANKGNIIRGSNFYFKNKNLNSLTTLYQQYFFNEKKIYDPPIFLCTNKKHKSGIHTFYFLCKKDSVKYLSFYGDVLEIAEVI